MDPKTAGDDMLRDAVQRNCALVLSLPSEGMVRHYKSRFLQEGEGGTSFVVESASNERPLIDACIANGNLAGISFKAGDQKVVFASRIIRRIPEMRISADVVVEALELTRPSEIKAIQRRSTYRVRVVPESDLSVRVWRLNLRATLGERPMLSQEITSTLTDLSCGGLGVILQGEDGQPPKISTEDRLRLQLAYRADKHLLIEGRLRPSTGQLLEGGRIRTGISFKKLESDLEGRQIYTQLTRLVGELQREEVRRMRLGLMSA